VSLGWTGASGDAPPNEDARLPTLEAGNLHALSRLPGEDAVEDGLLLALGATWTRAAPGLDTTLTFGRLVRSEPLDASVSSGLSGTRSDWLLEGRLDLGAALALDARALLDDAFAPRTTEARLAWTAEWGSLGAAWLRLPADPVEDRPDPLEELSLDGLWHASDRWTFAAEAELDLARDRLSDVELEATWRNECVEVDVTVGRSYTGSGDGDPSTSFGLSVDLLGFSAGDGARVRPGGCRG
jgi:LPS-assembly protein